MWKILKSVIIVAFGLMVLGLAVLYLYIGNDVKSNIEIAQLKYGGDAENSLIAMVQDDDNSYYDRTHIAIWTLGQIRSQKAYDIMRAYYKDDPNGSTCYGKHDRMLCQYELSKAIHAIEHRRLFSYAILK
jgi:hypothetical protein